MKASWIILPTCTHVIQHAEYGFTANLPISIVRAENFLLATHYNGQPLSPEHGYPAARDRRRHPR